MGICASKTSASLASSIAPGAGSRPSDSNSSKSAVGPATTGPGGISMPRRPAGAAAASRTSNPWGAPGASGGAPRDMVGGAATTGGAWGACSSTVGTSAYSGGAAGGPAAACGAGGAIIAAGAAPAATGAPGGSGAMPGGAATPGGTGPSMTASSNSGSPFLRLACFTFAGLGALACLGGRGALPTEAPIEDAMRATSASWQAGQLKTSLVSAMHVGHMPLPHSRHFPIACWPGCRSHST